MTTDGFNVLDVEEPGADTREILNKVPKLPQRQDSTEAQLRDLWAVANKLGLYDAADAIKPLAGLE